MNRRHRDILNLILNTDDCITGNELAKICNVTIRTIRSDIKDINDLLKEYTVEIKANIKKGYFLNQKDKDILKYNNVIRKVLDYEYIIETPNLPIDRQMYILLKLTTFEYMYVEELAEALYVSIATINNDIILINKWIKRDLKLGISYSLNKGITLKADEKEKRNIISWVLSKRLNISTVLKYWNYLFQDKEVVKDARNIYHILGDETRKHNYHLSGHSAQIFCYEILIAFNRERLGFYLEPLDGMLKNIINDIRSRVEDKLGINMSQREWINLQEYFESKQFLYGTDIKNIETEEANCVVDEFLETVKEKFDVDLMSNRENRYKFLLYVAPMIRRLKYNHCIANKIDENVVKCYKIEFKMANEIKKILKRKLNLEARSSEIAYITIHLASMCGLWKKNLKTIVVCDYDESIFELIKEKINNSFGEKIEICRFYDYQGFMYENKEELKNIDFIVTTSTIADITNIPFVRINYVMEQKDMDIIAEYLKSKVN
ncbi:PRD domain-containing protein [Clostridium sp. SHJSY1]|uniref:BglG family transcription antiterminator n=1 Tax=Clostridium sp. SHJSY1 TaxID=2942483 RepID=UPI0028744701|nr:PRD domain-containing protein [Clostridium sp. SHJSY1]MDS0526977.1 PRD domain-containing protein [Clostridium sp. SHJSY1]